MNPIPPTPPTPPSSPSPGDQSQPTGSTNPAEAGSGGPAIGGTQAGPQNGLPQVGGAPSPPFLVYGLNLVVRMKKSDEIAVPVQCPRGQPIQYGVVIAAGDGFDPQASQFRAMPPVGALVAFEETTEGIEGHYLFVDDDEFRVLHLDVITIGFPPK